MKYPIGIIGGMGPEASGYLYNVMIEYSVRYFGAKENNEFPEILLYSLPVVDFIASREKQDQTVAFLRKKIKQLDTITFSSLSFACNTVHFLLPKLPEVNRTPFVSMVTEVAQQIALDGKKKVGLLASPTTLATGLYQQALQAYGIEVILPKKQQISAVETSIRRVIAGEKTKKDKQNLVTIADSLVACGAEGIVLGCTELPLVFPQKYQVTLYNSVSILAMSLLRRYYN